MYSAPALSSTLKPSGLWNKRISTLHFKLIGFRGFGWDCAFRHTKIKSPWFNFSALFVHLYKCLQIISSSNLTSLSVYQKTFFVWSNCRCLSKDLISSLSLRILPETRVNSTMYTRPSNDILTCHRLIPSWLSSFRGSPAMFVCFNRYL